MKYTIAARCCKTVWGRHIIALFETFACAFQIGCTSFDLFFRSSSLTLNTAGAWYKRRNKFNQEQSPSYHHNEGIGTDLRFHGFPG
jgi:hypothetical protein